MKVLRKQILLALIYYVISFSALSYFFFFSAKIIKENQEEQLALELESISLYIEHKFREIENRLQSISYFIQMNPTDEELLEFLVQFTQKHPPVASIYLGRPDNTMVNSSGFVPKPGFDLTTRPWYLMAVNSQKIEFTPTFINATNDRIIVTATMAVYDQNDNFLGVLAADIDIRSIINFVSEKTICETGFAFLIDRNDKLIAYPELDASVIELKPLAVYEPNLESLQNKSETIFDFEIHNVKGVLMTKYIIDDHYLLGAFLSMQEYSHGLDVLKWFFSVLLITMLIIAIVFYIVYYNRINRPLYQLLNDIQKIDLKSTLSYRLPEPKKDDFLTIRKALNQVLQISDFYFSEGQKTFHDLVLENQRVFLLMQSTADIIFEIDLQLRFVSVFGRGLKTLKMEPPAFIGKTVIDIFGEDGRDREQAHRKALQGTSSVYDWTITINRKKLYFEASISPMYDENKHIIGAVGIARDITEYMQKQKKIEYLSLHDFLTGLYNRRHFVETMTKLDKPAYYPIGMMMIDLNGLKIFNDAYGHHTGDRALKKVAQVLSALENKNTIAFRIGGDEFALLISKTSNEALESLKEKIKMELMSSSIENISLSIAIGYEIKTNADVPFEEIMKNAENQMYRNKVTEGKSNRNNAIKAIVKTLTDKFDEEKTHLERVSDLCKKMGMALNLRVDDLRELEMAGFFHDIGKISVPDEILRKPEKLTKEEFEKIKSHTENGYHILRAADEYSNLADYALTHHERWDGTGYPHGIKQEEIPLFSRIIGIVDAFEAMTSDRVYRKKMSEDEAIQEIIINAGTQFDPELAKLFVEQVLKKKFTRKGEIN